ncbi:MAG: restriction endonuclease subunit S [Akkermansia muciniphila]|nr:restriction endonuclease subunit S [Akkermansia muciniphila]
MYIKSFDEKSLDIIYFRSFLEFYDLGRFAAGAGQPKITQKPLQENKLMLPPLPLQRQFAEFVTHIERMKGKVRASLEATQKLLGSLMQEYFS